MDTFNLAKKRKFFIDTKLNQGTKIEFFIDKNEKPEQDSIENDNNLNNQSENKEIL